MSEPLSRAEIVNGTGFARNARFIPMAQPFDMSKTIRHPDVIHARIHSIIDNISAHRAAIETHEIELRQLNEIVLEMLDTAAWEGS